MVGSLSLPPTQQAYTVVIKPDPVFARQGPRSLRGQFSGWTDSAERVRRAGWRVVGSGPTRKLGAA